MSAAATGDERARRARTTRLFLIAVLLHGLAYLAAVSPWMGEDEPWHFEYASHVAHGHSPTGGAPVSLGRDGAPDDRTLHGPAVLQVRSRRFGGMAYAEIEARQTEILHAMGASSFFRKVDWAGASPTRREFDGVEPFFTAATQPPLYYVALGAWLAPWTSLSAGAQLEIARLTSLALYVATAWLALLFARRVFADEKLALLAAFLVAWAPMHARQAALVNNDVLARFLASALLLVAARALSGELTGRLFTLGGALTVAGILCKSTVAGAVFLLGGALALTVASRVFAGVRVAHERRRKLLWLAVSLTAALALAALTLWLARSSPVVPKNVAAFLERIDTGLSSDTLSQTWRTLVGSFNWYSREAPEIVYTLALVVALAIAAGSSVVLARGRPGVSRPHLALCAAAVVAQVALVALRGVGHGRYLMPAVLAFGPLAVAGLVALWPERARGRAALIVVAVAFVYDAWFLWGGLVPNEYLVWSS